MIARHRLQLGAAPQIFRDHVFVSGHFSGIERHLHASLTVITDAAFGEHVYLAFPAQPGLGGMVRESAIGALAFSEPPIALGGRFLGFTAQRELIELDPVEGAFAVLFGGRTPEWGGADGAVARSRRPVPRELGARGGGAACPLVPVGGRARRPAGSGRRRARRAEGEGRPAGRVVRAIAAAGGRRSGGGRHDRETTARQAGRGAACAER
jgi:hypothetical protein